MDFLFGIMPQWILFVSGVVVSWVLIASFFGVGFFMGCVGGKDLGHLERKE